MATRRVVGLMKNEFHRYGSIEQLAGSPDGNSGLFKRIGSNPITSTLSESCSAFLYSAIVLGIATCMMIQCATRLEGFDGFSKKRSPYYGHGFESHLSR